MARLLVVDSGIVVKWAVEEPDSGLAESIYAAHESGAIDFAAPDLLFAEVGNILWKKVIFGGLSENEADKAGSKLQSVAIRIIAAADLFDVAFAIAKNYKRTFYDSLYLAASKRLNCEFVTADERLYNSVKSDFPNLVLLADWK